MQASHRGLDGQAPGQGAWQGFCSPSVRRGGYSDCQEKIDFTAVTRLPLLRKECMAKSQGPRGSGVKDHLTISGLESSFLSG